ncbi:hypothetical protein PYW07_008832 [Mythimna separata]|uniref:Peptidase S1 domain-containing protein n=1 Tax=Mythimna separata TaxID=271217 RepID=A0AAD7YAR9_MYTSE|nr:hypothetical protein PYW07_008832 [Mythimna separata]
MNKNVGYDVKDKDDSICNGFGINNRTENSSAQFIRGLDWKSETAMVSLSFTLLLVAGCAAVLANPAKIEDFPSIVQVETGYGRVWLQTCVGTILTSRHVLTAAHCLVGTALTPKMSRVRAGAGERGRDGQIVDVDSAIRHPDYTFKRFDSNVGIIRLAAYFSFSDKVARATIVASGVVFPANVAVTVASWGRTAQDVIWADRDLTSTRLYTTDNKACAARYADLPIPITITSNMICTAIPGTTGTHWGIRDGGSPVFYDGILVGFLSFGSPYGEKFPLVATSVSSFTDWIVENASY